MRVLIPLQRHDLWLFYTIIPVAAVAFRCQPCLLVMRRRGAGDISDGGAAAVGGGVVAALVVTALGGLPSATLEYADGTAVVMDGYTTSAEDEYGGDEDGYYTDAAAV